MCCTNARSVTPCLWRCTNSTIAEPVLNRFAEPAQPTKALSPASVTAALALHRSARRAAVRVTAARDGAVRRLLSESASLCQLGRPPDVTWPQPEAAGAAAPAASPAGTVAARPGPAAR